MDRRRNRILVAVAIVLALGLAFFAGRLSTANRVRSPDVAPGEANREGAELSATADFIITDALLSDPPSFEDHQLAATETSICRAEAIRVANAATGTVGLIDTPEESDAEVELGIVRPGGVFTLRPQEIGIFYISAAGRNGLLFRYKVEDCSERKRSL